MAPRRTSQMQRVLMPPPSRTLVKEIILEKTRSKVWDHCVKTKRYYSDGTIKEVATCRYCNLEMNGASSVGTRRIDNHLKTKCKTCPIYVGSVVLDGQTQIDKDTTTGSVVKHYFDQKRLDRRCMEMIIKDEMPFTLVEKVGFKSIVNDLCPRYVILNRKKVASFVWDLYLSEKDLIMKVIGNQRVSITTDTWTSIQLINYMVVTAHFLDGGWNLHKIIISFIPITSHKGEDIAKTLDTCLKLWGVENVFSICVDNASANDVAVASMKNKFEATWSLLVNGKYLHVRCCCHILNLIVKDGLKKLATSIEGIRNAVKFLHSSPARLDKFRQCAITEGMSSMCTVPMDVCTRWNSTYLMLDAAYDYKSVFEKLKEEYTPFRDYFTEKLGDCDCTRVGPPTEEDWVKSKAFVGFLKRFYDATLKLSASKSVTSNLMFREMVAIRLYIQTRVNGTDLVLKEVAKSMQSKFDKYWKFSEVNKVVFLATVLDPRLKIQFIRDRSTKMGLDSKAVDDLSSEIEKCLTDLYDVYRGRVGLSGTRVMNIGEDDEDETLDGIDDDLMEFHHSRKDAQVLFEVTNEVEKYFRRPYEKLTNKSFNLLVWWKDNESSFPISSKIAKDIFACPSSTVASESAFSLGGRIVDPFRTSLTPKMVEALVCSKDWLCGEEFSYYKEPTDEEMDLYKELERIELGVSSDNEMMEMDTEPGSSTN